MNGVPEPGPPQFLTIEGDQLIYCEGRLAWYFYVNTKLYWVTRPEFFLQLPTWEQLKVYRIQDRHRLWQWLGDPDRRIHSAPVWGENGFKPADYQQQVLGNIPPFTPPPPRRPVYPHERSYDPPVAPKREPVKPRINPLHDPARVERHAKEREKLEKARQARADKLNQHRREDEVGVDVKRRVRLAFLSPVKCRHREYCDFGAVTSAFLTDHDYIEAMFNLYSQQRFRML